MRTRAEHGQLTGRCSLWLERARLRRALPHIPDGSAILDIGCGRAAVLQHRRPQRYVGVDVIPELIEHNRRRHPAHTFVMQDVADLDLSPFGRFDVILLLAVVEHLKRPPAVLSRLRNVLTAEGAIILTTPHPRADWVLRSGAFLGLCSPESHDEHESLLARTGLDRLAGECGLAVRRYRRFLLGLNQILVLGRDGLPHPPVTR